METSEPPNADETNTKDFAQKFRKTLSELLLIRRDKHTRERQDALIAQYLTKTSDDIASMEMQMKASLFGVKMMGRAMPAVPIQFSAEFPTESLDALVRMTMERMARQNENTMVGKAVPAPGAPGAGTEGLPLRGTPDPNGLDGPPTVTRAIASPSAPPRDARRPHSFWPRQTRRHGMSLIKKTNGMASADGVDTNVTASNGLRPRLGQWRRLMQELAEARRKEAADRTLAFLKASLIKGRGRG